MGEGGNI